MGTLLADGKCSLLVPPRNQRTTWASRRISQTSTPRATPSNSSAWMAITAAWRRSKAACGMLPSACRADASNRPAGISTGCSSGSSTKMPCSQRFRQAQRDSEWLASPLPRFAFARPWPGGIIPLGNAAAAIEPVGGEGMGLAMRSAEMAATMLLAGAIDIARLRQKLSTTLAYPIHQLPCRSKSGVASKVGQLGRAGWTEFGPLTRSMMALTGKRGICENLELQANLGSC